MLLPKLELDEDAGPKSRCEVDEKRRALDLLNWALRSKRYVICANLARLAYLKGASLEEIEDLFDSAMPNFGA